MSDATPHWPNLRLQYMNPWFLWFLAPVGTSQLELGLVILTIGMMPMVGSLAPLGRLLPMVGPLAQLERSFPLAGAGPLMEFLVALVALPLALLQKRPQQRMIPHLHLLLHLPHNHSNPRLHLHLPPLDPPLHPAPHLPLHPHHRR